VRFYVAITDYEWFKQLSALRPDEVNFWRPSGQRFSLTPSEPLLFKLHRTRKIRRDFIVGGGFFSHFTALPLTFAWDVFGTKNGAADLQQMRQRVWKYREKREEDRGDEVIGCVLLQQPFFFPEQDWIPVSDWSSSVQVTKIYDTSEPRGNEIWAQVQARLASPQPELDESVVAAERFGKPQIILPRLGQGAFRVIVADTYKRACALSSSHILHILDAAHIRPYSKGGTHSPTNGLLLRQDIHTLFDRGYLTVTPEYKVEVSKRIKEEFNNGEDYYKIHGKLISLPAVKQLQPSVEALNWHNEHIFKS